METEFLRREGKYNIYSFKCDCGVYGKIGVPADSRHLFDHSCDNRVLLIQRLPAGMFDKPRLEEISVQPGGAA